MSEKKDILIVEDNPDHAELASIALRRSESDYEISIARSVQEALNVFGEKEFSTILLDYSLKGDTGITFLEKIRAVNKDLPVIIVTGLGSEKIAVEAMKMGAYDYIVKSVGYLDMLPITVHKSIKYYENVLKRKQAEAQIQENLRLSEILLDSLPHPAMLIDKNKIVLTANKIAKELGINIGSPCWESMPSISEQAPGEKLSCDQCFFDNAMADKKPYVLSESRFAGRTWETHWIPLGNDKILVYRVDITKRKQEMDLLDKTNKCFLSFGTDPQLNIKKITETAGSIFGGTFSVYIKGTNSKVNIEEDWNFPEELRNNINWSQMPCYKAIQNSEGESVFRNHLDQDNASNNPLVSKYHIKSFICSPVKFCNSTIGALSIFFTTNIDLEPNELKVLSILSRALGIEEERKDSEEKIKRAAEEWESTFQSITDLVSIHDKDYNLIRVNKVYSALFNKKPEEIIGKKCYELFHGSTLPPEGCPHRKTVESKKPVRSECYEPHLGIYLEVSTSPIFDDNGEVTSYIHIAKDVTDRKKMEEDLFRTRKLESIGILAGGIAHDFNNLLTGILGYISMAKVHASPDINIINMLDEAEKASIRARDLSQQLLTFSKGGAPIKRTASIGDLVRDSIKFVLRGTKTVCDFEIPDDLWQVDVDEGQINQVLNNITINACQAMPDGGKMHVSCENVEIKSKDPISLKKGAYVKISIKDFGCGIAQENIEKVFDPYFTTKSEGSGLGLATCYSIIKRHNGKITVDSKPGEGTTFSIYIPVLNKEPLKKKEEILKSFETKKVNRGRILIMDDEAMIRNLLSEMLRYSGFEVVQSKDGDEAIQLYKTAMEEGHAFDAVVMDLTVPGGMGGKEAVEMINKIDSNARVIVSSGYSNDPIMANYKKYGFSGVIEKPYKVDQLISILQTILP